MPTTEYVTLRGGLSLPLPALELAWSLERRGFHLGTDGDALTVGPKSMLTEADHRQIKAHRDALKVIAEYACEVVA